MHHAVDYLPHASWWPFYIPVYHLSSQQLITELNIDVKTGLSEDQLRENRATYGSNLLPPPRGRSMLSILLSQFLNAITFILFACVIVTAVNHEYIDMSVILVIIFVNVLIGFFSELKSESSLAALAQMSKGQACTLRGGATCIIDIDDVVVGDVLVLKSGDVVPADARVVQSNNLEVDEMLLTGESVCVFKGTEPLPIPQVIAGLDVRVAIGDRSNMVFRQTTIVSGAGLAIVTATGTQTKIGALSERLQAGNSRQKTTFQKNLDLFMYILFGVALFLAFLIFCIVQFKINEEVIVYAASTAIALLPEALIMVTTISLALAMQRLASNKAIVRKMSVLTDLASLTHALSDKTGTLTEGKMVCKRVWPHKSPYIYHITGGAMDLTGGFGIEYDPTDTSAASAAAAEAYNNTRAARAATRAQTRGMSLHGSLHQSETSRVRQPSFEHAICKVVTGTKESELVEVQRNCEELALVAAMCNNTVLQIDEENDCLVGSGFNPTEAALTVFTYKLGMPSHFFEDEYGWYKCGSHAFDSKIKRMSVGIARNLFDEQGHPTDKRQSLVLTKGAAEAILPLCNNVNTDEVLTRVDHLAGQGFRVLACAIGNHLDVDDVDGKRLNELDRALVESPGHFKFVGLCVVFDPPREESFIAVEKCKQAGISFSMVTGDHILTATNIARRLKILEPHHGDEYVITGPVVDAMSPEELDALEHFPLVCARSSPESKVRLVESLQRRGKVVSITGDGINDCPALAVANCGFAMGIAGTDLTKNTADITLLDDNISTMINTIEQGRAITASIKKFIVHLLTSNIAEVIVLLVGLVFRDNTGEVVFPLTALEILTVNLITSSPPAIGLTLDPPDPELMQQPPSPKGSLFTPEVFIDQGIYGFVMSAFCFVSYILVIFAFGDGDFGSSCNNTGGESTCQLVWRARTTCFAVLYQLLLVQGYVCRHPRKSVFSQSLISNPVLVASFVLGTLFILPCIYIPWVATNLFKHGMISWEWIIVLVSMIGYLATAEFYKFIKRGLFGTKGTNKSLGNWAQRKNTAPRKGYVTTEDGGVIELR